MTGKVILEVTTGDQAGKRYEYDQVERIFVGRQEDCGIVLPVKTVSRYHCLLNINPPIVMLQDFGSLNGTYINDQKIGQRERDLSVEEARGVEHTEYELHDGDRIRLGKSCEIKCSIEQPQIQPILFSERFDDPDGTVPEDYLPDRSDIQDRLEQERKEEERRKAEREEAERREAERKEAERKEAERKQREEEERKEAERREAERRQKEAERKKRQEEKAAERKEREAERKRKEAEQKEAECKQREEEERKRKEEERRRKEEERKRKEEEERKRNNKKICRGCGKAFVPTAEDNNLCPNCLSDQGKLLDGILAVIFEEMDRGNEDRHEPKLEASPLEGFDKVACLGKGGMGEVWKVKERKTGKIYALKTMLPQVAADNRGKRQFLREAKLCEQLRHKNVIRTYQTGCQNNVFYILMDLCEGGSAEDLLNKNGGKLTLDMATWIILQALDGLDYVHNADVTAEIRKKGLFAAGTREVEAKGVVHRDFKPGNIFLSDRTDHPVAVVADFGMAKAFETAGLTNMTDSGTSAGTIPFMPRQQALDYRFSKPSVDVWAAAASYYYMLTGRFPKNLKPGPLAWQSLVSEKAVPIRQRDPRIPARLAQVIDHALEESPEIGYSSAAEFRKEIVAALPQETMTYCKRLLKQ